MRKKYAIFDMDGTLADSMPSWFGSIYEHIERRGAKITPQFKRFVTEASFAEMLDYCRAKLNLEIDGDELKREIEDDMREEYATAVRPKRGAAELLKKLKENGWHMCVLSATKREMSEPALKHLGLLGYFDFVSDCTGFPDGKNSDVVYLAAADRMKALPGETVVFEDSRHSVFTVAKSAFSLVAVYDDVTKDYEDEMRAAADLYVKDFTDPELTVYLGL